MVEVKRKVTKAFLKTMAKELEAVVQPQDDKGKAISLTKGNLPEIQKNVKNAAGMLNTADTISEDLEWLVTEHFGIEIPEKGTEPETEEDSDNGNEAASDAEETKDDEWSLDEIMGMDKPALIELCEESNLISEADDYIKIKDFRIAVAEEMGFDVPEETTEDAAAEEPSKEDLTIEIKRIPKLKELKAFIADNIPEIDIAKYKGVNGLPALKKAAFALLKGTAKKTKETKETPTPKETKETPAKTEGKKRTQTNAIREMMAAKIPFEKQAEALSKEFDKTIGWANARIKVYQNAYGENGENDTKIA